MTTGRINQVAKLKSIHHQQKPKLEHNNTHKVHWMMNGKNVKAFCKTVIVNH